MITKVLWLATLVCVVCFGYYFTTSYVRIITSQLNNTRPLVQLIDISKPIKDNAFVSTPVPYAENGLIISKYDTNQPMDGYRELHWNSRCRGIEGFILQTLPNTQPTLTVYYREGCR